jgi:hypothetical protein
MLDTYPTYLAYIERCHSSWKSWYRKSEGVLKYTSIQLLRVEMEAQWVWIIFLLEMDMIGFHVFCLVGEGGPFSVSMGFFSSVAIRTPGIGGLRYMRFLAGSPVLSVADFMCSWNNSSVHIDSTMWSICLWDLLKPHETTNPYQSYVPGWVIEFRVSTPCCSDCPSLKVRQPRRIFYVASLAKACFTKGRVANGCTVAECEQHNKAICQRLDSDFKVQFIYLL